MARVVVGFDGSPAAAEAVRWAAAEARLRHLEVVILAAVEQGAHEVDTSGDGERLAELRQTAVRLAEDVPARFEVLHGDPAAAALSGACTADDLLVVGSRGRSPFAGLLLGSVSRACLHHAPATVVVVRPAADQAAGPAPTHGRVVVGIDESEHARRALVVAAEEAALRGAVLEVIHAVHWDHLGVELIVPTTRQLLTWGKELVASQLAATGVDARVTVLNGHAGDLLVRHSSRADLLVVGSRGHHALDSLVLGSTSDHCARHAACPVMVVRTGE